MKSAQSVLLSGLGSSSVLLSVRGVGVDGGGGVGGRGHHVRHSGSVPSMQVLYDSYAQSSRSKFSPPRPLFSRACLVGVFNTVLQLGPEKSSGSMKKYLV